MIESIRLENFRRFTQAEFRFAPLTIITGNNGSGKTSILEAIAMLSLTTSWRTDKDTEVVRWQAPFTRVVSGEKELVVQISPYLKRIRLDGVSKRIQQVIGHFPSVLFQPDDLQLLYGAPAYRRQYMDRVIAQTSPNYTQALLRLGKVLKQRNRLLKNIKEGVAAPGELQFWDEQLSELHLIFQEQRRYFLAELQSRVPRVFAGMVNGGESFMVHYQPSPATGGLEFKEHLRHNREKEIAAGSSLYGPHREDVSLVWQEHSAQESMSRGQARALLVAFKIAELEYISQKNEHRPVLLLDDIFSELDQERRERLVEVFGDYQVIITTTELGTVQKLLKDEAMVIEL